MWKDFTISVHCCIVIDISSKPALLFNKCWTLNTSRSASEKWASRLESQRCFDEIIYVMQPAWWSQWKQIVHSICRLPFRAQPGNATRQHSVLSSSLHFASLQNMLTAQSIKAGSNTYMCLTLTHVLYDWEELFHAIKSLKRDTLMICLLHQGWWSTTPTSLSTSSCHQCPLTLASNNSAPHPQIASKEKDSMSGRARKRRVIRPKLLLAANQRAGQ